MHPSPVGCILILLPGSPQGFDPVIKAEGARKALISARAMRLGNGLVPLMRDFLNDEAKG